MQVKQQLLPYQVEPNYSYGYWVSHAGVHDTETALARCLNEGGFFWFTSEQVAGKSHFLKALSDDHENMQLISVPQDIDDVSATDLVQYWLEELLDYDVWAIDLYAGAMPRTVALALYHLIERAKSLHKGFILSWRADGFDDLPPEFSSRLQACEPYILHQPVDESVLKQILCSIAEARQWSLDEQTLSLMIHRLQRSLPSLLHALQCMERESMRKHRKMNIAWARQFMRDYQEPGHRT